MKLPDVNKEWVIQNKDIIVEKYKDKFSTTKFLDKNDHSWNFFPHRTDILEEFDKRVEAESKVGCSSCRLNTIKHSFINAARAFVVKAFKKLNE